MAQSAKTRRSPAGWASQLFQHPLVLTSFYGLVIVTALVADRFLDAFNTTAFFVGVGAASAIVLLNIVISSVAFQAARKHDLDEKLALVSDFIDGQGQGWIVNHRYINNVETLSSETWIFSRELINDLDTASDVYRAVAFNLAKGRRYRYFLPDVPSSRAVVARYVNVHKFKPHQVSFYLVPETEFLFYTEVAVYDADQLVEMSAVEWMPHKDLNYYICMDHERAMRVRGIGQMFIDRIVPYSPS